MRYICTNCSYIYDESLWDLLEWYKPGTKLEDMNDYFLCPVCWENADSFQEIKEEINYLKDEDFLSEEELLHYPVIDLKDGKIKVSVWKEEKHPNEDNHFITSIALYDEYWDLVEEKFLNSKDDWIAIFDDYDLDSFEIRIRCNLHGVWSLWVMEKVSWD